MRERLSSRIGFIFLSAGCAIGLGNVWRFPSVAGRNGGGLFVLMYLVCLALIGVPLLAMEFATGRAAQRSVAGLHAALTPARPAWRAHGLLGVAGNLLLMMFYTTVTGWMLVYFIGMAGGALSGCDAAAAGERFGALLGDPLTMGGAMLAVTAVSAAVCAVGLQRGVERVSKGMMACLFAMILVLAANSLWLDAKNGGAGLRFYLVPDLEQAASPGFLATAAVEAMKQAFFTLSLGIGAMAIFGSYVGRDRALLGESLWVTGLDTFVALAAGLIVIPACLAHKVDPGAGPGLVFVTLPAVFGAMPGGRLWGTLFFAFMACAALTTVVAVFECLLACLMETAGWSRRKAGLVTGAAVAVLSVPCVLGFNVWKAFAPFGPGTNVLDLEDFVVSGILLPLGGIGFAVYCTRRFGWGWDCFRAEANAGEGQKVPGGRLARLYCSWILPALIFVVFILGLLDRLRHLGD